MTREERTIMLLRSFEPTKGYHLAFSGGKDSQVLLHVCEKANVKFTAYFYRTSVDPPEVIDFIKSNYPDVEIIRPKLTMYQVILKRKMLPTRHMRFCCKDLKEYAGNGEVVLTGIRNAESFRRQARATIEYDKEQTRLLIHPIKEWSDNQVWTFLKKNKIQVNTLYAEGFGRIGCIGCPMSTANDRTIMFNRYPNHKTAYVNTIKKLRENGYFKDFESAEDVFLWWVSNETKNVYFANKNQLKINCI